MGYFITNVPVPAWDEELLVWVKQEDGLDGPTPQQESAIEYISNMQLSAEMIESLRCYYLEKYYDRVDIPIDETRIMDFCSLVMAFVPVHKTSNRLFVLLSFRCDWDTEYGMNIFIVDGCVEWHGRHGVDRFLGEAWPKMLDSECDSLTKRIRALAN